MKGDVDIDVDANVDIDRYVGCLKRVSKSVQVLRNWHRTSYSTDLDSSIVGSLTEGSKGEGYLRHVGEPEGVLGKTRESRGVLSCLLPLQRPSDRDSMTVGRYIAKDW